MKFVAILSLAILAAAEYNNCPAYVCDPSGVTWADGVCAMRDTNTSQYDLKTGECSSDQLCLAELLTLSPTVNCASPSAPQPVVAAYPGENCDVMHTCVGGVECTAGKCATITTDCVNVYDCGLNNACSGGKCVTLAIAGAACTLDTDCANGAGCDIVFGGAAGSGKCVTYNSVAAGTQVQTCAGTTANLAAHALCSSGYCFETATAGTFQCAGSVSSATTPPIRVTAAPFTCKSTTDTTSSMSLTWPTGCGFDGFPYCPLFPGDSEYSNYANVITSFIGSSSLSNCNTARHGGPGAAFSVDNYFWCAQNLTDSQTYSMYRATLYPEVIMAESCQLKILTPAYYKAEGAESLIFGGLLLALLQ